ncbi:MAG TPA: hypothetical protein VG757_07460 [Devosia sp.]|nr:hypothetical protein [Devosia sp.]
MLALIAPLASLLGIEVGALVERYRREAIVWGIVGGFLGIGAVFLLVAANAALSFSFGPVVAPLLLAGAAILIALAVYLGARIRANASARAEAERKRGAETTALVTSAAITAVPILVKSPLFKKVGLPLGGALAAAYLLSKPSASHKD